MAVKSVFSSRGERGSVHRQFHAALGVDHPQLDQIGYDAARGRPDQRPITGTSKCRRLGLARVTAEACDVQSGPFPSATISAQGRRRRHRAELASSLGLGWQWAARPLIRVPLSSDANPRPDHSFAHVARRSAGAFCTVVGLNTGPGTARFCGGEETVSRPLLVVPPVGSCCSWPVRTVAGASDRTGHGGF
jgi:hypothetical protein